MAILCLNDKLFLGWVVVCCIRAVLVFSKYSSRALGPFGGAHVDLGLKGFFVGVVVLVGMFLKKYLSLIVRVKSSK